MKKSNYIVMAVALIASAFLLWLWFYLGFNEVDYPLDLVLSILWWVVDILVVVLIVCVERKRREQIRTIYVAPAVLFNSECGVVAAPDTAGRTAVMEQVLQGLAYGFKRVDMPKREDFECLYVVQTKKYKPADAADIKQGDAAGSGEPVWEGKVIKIDRQAGNIEAEFSSRGELAALLRA